MDIPLNELLAALPDDNDSSIPELPREEMERIFADLAMRRPPITSLHRAWTLGELSAQIALAFAARTVRGWFANESDRARAEAESNLRIALKIFHRLGYLRGALMKAGQFIGTLPHPAPAQIVETMDCLHFSAPPMHYSLIREVLANELGDDPEALFHSFEKQAFAAASIGQVHRAVLKTGEQVAVKIQYPGIARAIDSDLRTLSLLVNPLRTLTGTAVDENFEYLRRVLKDETDYEREAESIRFAGALFADRIDIAVPRVHEKHSGMRVLTMDYLSGKGLKEFIATNPSQELRDAFGARVCLSWHRMLDAKVNYADPHSGNYIFMDDGRLGLIDFGCMNHLTDPDFDTIRRTFRFMDTRDQVRQQLIEWGATESTYNDEEYLRLLVESTALVKGPMISPQPFDYGQAEHLERRLEWGLRISRNKSVLKGTSMWLFYHRAAFSLMSMLYRLRARVDMNALPTAYLWN